MPEMVNWQKRTAAVLLLLLFVAALVGYLILALAEDADHVSNSWMWTKRLAASRSSTMTIRLTDFPSGRR